MKSSLTLLLFSLLVGCATPTGVQMKKRASPGSDFGPWSTSEDVPVVASASHTGSARTAGPNDGFVDFVFSGYSRYLTRIDGPRCEHRPTCSHYALLSVKQHGYLVGSWMTIDRLLRGSRSSVLRPLELYKIEDGQRYYYDPVDNNDFFF